MSIRTSAILTTLLAALLPAAFAAEPKVAVTDLTYQERVSQYFRAVSASSNSSFKASSKEHETHHTYSARDKVSAQSQSSYSEVEGVYTYIDRGELRTYTADLKGNLLKGGGVRLVQAKPYTGKPTEQIFDIISRIKQGYYPGADYVLFGTVSNIEFRQESMPLTVGTSATATLSLDLVADFSLINTSTYEVKAAFSATGSGQDTKIVSNLGDRIAFNRGKVIAETSRALAESAYSQLVAQLGLAPRAGVLNPPVAADARAAPNTASPVRVY